MRLDHLFSLVITLSTGVTAIGTSFTFYDQPNGEGNIVGEPDFEPNGLTGPKPEVCVQSKDGVPISSFVADKDSFGISSGLGLASTQFCIKQYENIDCDEEKGWTSYINWNEDEYPEGAHWLQNGRLSVKVVVGTCPE